MIPLINTAVSREIDERASAGSLVRSYSYMQRAAQGVAAAVTSLMEARDGEIAVLCGKGNNGGDGYVAARILRDSGYSVVCYSLNLYVELSEAAQLAQEEFRSLGGTVTQVRSAEDLAELSRYELLIDAVLGSGINADPQGIYADAIMAINSCDSYTLSIDIPSGLNGDNGDRSIPTVDADKTVVCGFPRPAHLFFPGRFSTGEIDIRRIGYDVSLIPELAPKFTFFESEDLAGLIPPRRPQGNKYTHGTVSIISGSRGMAGATALAAESVLRSGAGMCYCIVPESIVMPLSTKVTEPVIIAAPETEEGTIAHRIGAILHNIEEKSRVKLIGPGLSRNEETAVMVRDTVRVTMNPIVLDGDGLNAFIGNEELFRGIPRLVITPHEGEWERLFGAIPTDPIGRMNRVADVAREYRITIVLKGMPTLVANDKGEVTVVQAGNSGMATAGSGDVLSGIIAGIIAQGASPFEGALAGAAIHGAAGDFAAEKKSEYSLLASDIVANIGEVFQGLES